MKCRFFMLLACLLMAAACLPASAAEITGVSIQAFSSQLPGLGCGGCNRPAAALVSSNGFEPNGPGTHSIAPDGGNMWLSENQPDGSFIGEFVTFNLGAVYDLDRIRIWNYNEGGGFNGTHRGVREMEIQISADNVNFKSLGIYTLDKAQQFDRIDIAQTIPFRYAGVRYVRFNVLSSHLQNQAADAFVGLSKVRFYTSEVGQTIPASGRVLHLDASDINGDGSPFTGEPAPGSTVATWIDKSGNGNHGTGSGDPTLELRVANGRPGIRFDGDDMFTTGNFAGMSAGDIFIVLKQEMYPPQNGSLTGLWHFTDSNGLQSHYSWVSGHIYDNWGSTTRKEAIVPQVPVDQWNFYNVMSKAGEWTARMNSKVIRTEGNAVNFFNAPARIGRSFDGVFFHGDIAEVILYNRELAAAERMQVERYLREKYGLGANYNFPANPPPHTEGLMAHYDASTVTGLFEGQGAGQWMERSGGGFLATGVGSPLFTHTGIGGDATMRFNGGNEFQLGNLASTFPTGATGFFSVRINNDVSYNILDTLNNHDQWWRYEGNGLSYPGSWRNPRVEAYGGVRPHNAPLLFMTESRPDLWQMF